MISPLSINTMTKFSPQILGVLRGNAYLCSIKSNLNLKITIVGALTFFEVMFFHDTVD